METTTEQRLAELADKGWPNDRLTESDRVELLTLKEKMASRSHRVALAVQAWEAVHGVPATGAWLREIADSVPE